MSIEFERVNLLNRIERVWANPPSEGFLMSNYRYPAGEFGACLSHMKALVQAIKIGAEAVLIFEDDISLSENVECRLASAFDALPENWRVLYLGGRPKSRVTRVGACLVKVGRFASAMSYAVSGAALSNLFELFLDRLSRPFPNACCDNILAELASIEGYCVYPPVCISVPGYSVLRSGMRDYTKQIERDWKRYGLAAG